VPFLILSDIHANLEALDAVLADAAGLYDRIVCLGDLVDYGADPNPVVDWARENLAKIVRGNHDKAAVGLDPIDTYNPAAQASSVWTTGALSPDNRAYLENLPRGPLRYEGMDLVHGSPFDEDEYLILPEDAAYSLAYLQTSVTFFGHTHLQGGFMLGAKSTQRILPSWTLRLDSNYFYLVNPGSVGQPRDRDPRAAYAIYSPEERAVEFRRVTYNVDRAAAKIRAAGLPDFLAARLHEGT